jgi:hypothetical protein
LLKRLVETFGLNVCPEKKICHPYGWQIFLKICDSLNRLPKRLTKRLGKIGNHPLFITNVWGIIWTFWSNRANG